MLYMAIRYGTQPPPMMFLAFVPYAFLGYYLERVRPGKLRRRKERRKRVSLIEERAVSSVLSLEFAAPGDATRRKHFAS